MGGGFILNSTLGCLLLVCSTGLNTFLKYLILLFFGGLERLAPVYLEKKRKKTPKREDEDSGRNKLWRGEHVLDTEQ